MKKRYRKLPIFEEVLIQDIAAEGVSIARVKKESSTDKEMIVFVERCIPGDVVDIQVTKKQSNFMQGYPVKYHKFSEFRIDAKCSHFGVCGGCKWQFLPYSLQLEYKHKQVLDQLKHIGRLDLPVPEKIIASDSEYFYRNKLEFTFSNKRWLQKEEINDLEKELDALGFHVPGKFDKVLDLDHCYLQGGLSDEIRIVAKMLALEMNLEFFDLREQKGFLRNLIVRNSSTTNDLMIIVSFYYDNEKIRTSYLQQLSEKFPQISSLLYVINPKKNDTIADLPVKLFKGKEHIIEKMEDLEFKVGPKSFFQTNSFQAYKLYCVVRDYAALQGNEIVYDLYTGTGTIANFIAKNAKKVIGIEYIKEAIEDAKENSAINQIENTFFYAGDMKDVLNEDFIAQNGKPDLIILDPPRAGVHKSVIDSILLTDVHRIIYVSCNAATQARDIQLLSHIYRIEKIQPVDMFPQTAHVENVVLLVKK